MRITDIISESTQPLSEGGNSSGVRYNSEVALLHVFAGAKAFDPNDVAGSFDANKLPNFEQIVAGIEKFLVPVYHEEFFGKWHQIGQHFKKEIAARTGSLPTKLDWVGGANAGPVADVEFLDHETSGISVKDSGGITLKNLTPKTLGIEAERGIDVFKFHADEHYTDMKTKVFNKVMDEAKASPDTVIAPKSPKYTIEYVSGTDTFKCVGKKTIDASREDILARIDTNAGWQRVFGEWYTANFQQYKEFAAPLYQSIAKTFERVIEMKLQDIEALSAALAFEDKPYFYAKPGGLYYVPSKNDVTDLKVKSLKYGQPDGTSQSFIAYIGYPDSDEAAKVTIYIRYANGMFETNPTVRVQSLTGAEHLGWEKLI